jgi:epoxyqueuosine reductase
MHRFVDEVFGRLREFGYQAQMISVEHLPLLQKQIEEQRSEKLLDNQFFKERLSWVRFQVPESLQKAQSIIVAAVPRPQTRAVFTWNGVRRPLILPPTYTTYESIMKQVQDMLTQLLTKKGYAVARTALPLKLLAARSGLVQYGRNNITYAPGLGSFMQLAAYYSDMPCEKDSWQEPTMMQACERCDLCRRACPTGAISSDRFLLRAELCISYHNEKKGDIPFPSWMDASWHNCIEGCMRCQRACPVDKQFLDWVEDEEEFSEEETAMLLEGIPREKLPEETVRKLTRLDILNDVGILPRNLGVFFKRR